MFYLKKHYFDGIDEAGNAVIIYGATLRFLGVNLPYASYLCADQHGVREQSCIRSLNINTDARIAQSRLKLSGQWLACAAPLRVRLIDDRRYFLDWHVHQPKSAFRLKLYQQSFSGMGYAETLETNIAPWRLPLRELRWGRFLSTTHYLVWVQWCGERPLQKLFYNGREINDFTLDDHALMVHHANIALYFEQVHLLKDAPLADLATRYPFLRLLATRRFWQTHERKYGAQARLVDETGASVQGQALYETVSWAK